MPSTMQTFKINEIFYSLQGEGYFTGTPAIFIRFSGCNLHCPFCDTNHQSGHLMTAEEIVAETNKFPASHIVLTGGEPSLFVTPELVDMLHANGHRRIAIETNGTHSIPDNIDWITLSPKAPEYAGNERIVLSRCDELKVVYEGQNLAQYDRFAARHRFLQPCDYGDKQKNAENTAATIRACLSNPQWRLSLQTHKFLNIR